MTNQRDPHGTPAGRGAFGSRGNVSTGVAVTRRGKWTPASRAARNGISEFALYSGTGSAYTVPVSGAQRSV